MQAHPADDDNEPTTRVPTTREATPQLARWGKRTEWPLATAAIIFLAAYTVRVLTEPQGGWETALQWVFWLTWTFFAVDYLGRLCLAAERRRWFVRHVVDLAMVSPQKAIGGPKITTFPDSAARQQIESLRAG